LCSYNLQQCDATPPTPAGGANSAHPDQTSWLDFGERKGRRKVEGDGKERAMGKEMERKGTGENEKRTKGKEGDGRKEKGKGKRKGGILCSCDFSLGKSRGLLGTLASLAETAEPSEMSSAEERTHCRNSEQPGVG